MRFFLASIIISILLAGCATPVSRWHDEAFSRFNTVVSAGSQQFAPDETDNIRQTLSLADRYYSKNMVEDADRLYQLSTQKSQLLYRTLVLGMVADVVSPALETESYLQVDEIEVYGEHITPEEAVQVEQTVNPFKLLEQPLIVMSGKMPYRTENLRSAKRRSTSLHNGKSNRVAALDVSRLGNPAGTTIYLTFDDGPSHLTLPIATFLKSQGVQATFFVLGSNVTGREKAITATIAMGHRVGNHTLSHNLKKLLDSLASESSEVQRTGAMIERLGGDGRMVRIPYGASEKSIISHVAADGGQIFEWDINSNDSTQRGVRDHLFIEKSILNQLNKNAKKTCDTLVS